MGGEIIQVVCTSYYNHSLISGTLGLGVETLGLGVETVVSLDGLGLLFKELCHQAMLI